MIEQTKAYKVGEHVFLSLVLAQVEALREILEFNSPDTLDKQSLDSDNTTLVDIVENKSKIIAVLSMEESSAKPRKPRSDKGKAHAKSFRAAAVNAALQDMDQ